MGCDYYAYVFLGVKVNKKDITTTREIKSCEHYDDYRNGPGKFCPICGRQFGVRESIDSGWLHELMWEGGKDQPDIIIDEYSEDVFIGKKLSRLDIGECGPVELPTVVMDTIMELYHALVFFFTSHGLDTKLLNIEDMKLYHIPYVSC